MANNRMFSLTCFRKAFTPILWLSILALIVCLIFVRLGFWQIERSQEKKDMVLRQDKQKNNPPLIWQPGKELPHQYQPIQVSGKYLKHILLLDNQHHDHQIGFHVITPMMLNSNELVLVDRGWVPASQGREQLPDIKTPDNLLTIVGSAYFPSENKIKLGQMIERSDKNKTVIEWIDTQDIGHFLHYSVYPYIIRLGKDQPHGFIRDWKVVSMPPERHMAYAVQWFAMAFVIALIWLVLTYKKYHENQS